MIVTQSLGFEEARKIVEAILKAAVETPPPDNRPVSIAVVDPCGDLLYFARMDGTHAVTVHMAINKAYSAVRMRRDTVEQQQMSSEGADIAWLGNDRLTWVPGGVLIKAEDGSIAGAVGISGRRAMGPMGDEELARIGAKALMA